MGLHEVLNNDINNITGLNNQLVMDSDAQVLNNQLVMDSDAQVSYGCYH